MFHRKIRLKTNKGFTLMEVSAAMMLVGMALVAVMQMFSIGHRHMKHNMDRLVMLNLLRRKVEEIKATPFISVGDETSFEYPGFVPFSFDVTTSSNYLGNPHLKLIDVTITRVGDSYTDRVVFLRAEYGEG